MALDISSLIGMVDQKKSQVTSTALNMGKGLLGAIQASKAEKSIKKLMADQPVYKRPEEYATQLAMALGSANQTQMPGQAQVVDNINSAAASARGASERTAISSNVLNRNVGDIYQKQLEAFQNLGIQAANWRDTQKQNLMGVLGQGANYSDTEWDQNTLQPWNMQMNMAQSSKQAGYANLWGGAEGAAVAANNYAGTSYAQNIMKNLMGSNNGAQQGTNGNVLISPSVNYTAQNGQQDLLKFLQGYKGTLNTNG